MSPDARGRGPTSQVAPGPGAGALIPPGARTHLAHAALQVIAQEAGVDLLHIKGPAVDPSIGRPRFRSTDADVLVRPEHVEALSLALAAHGWRPMTTFTTGSAFEHAATWHHSSWGYTDVHRFFPGVQAPDAFEVLWASRRSTEIASVPCPVPDLDAQRLLVLLHVARSGRGFSHPDHERVWGGRSPQEREALRHLAHRLGADVALAAALGELDAWRQDTSHDLWELYAQGGHTRTGEWLARVRAAQGPRAKAQLLWRMSQVNTDALAIRLGHRPTRAEVAVEWLARPRMALREAATASRDWLRRRTGRRSR